MAARIRAVPRHVGDQPPHALRQRRRRPVAPVHQHHAALARAAAAAARPAAAPSPPGGAASAGITLMPDAGLDHAEHGGRMAELLRHLALHAVLRAAPRRSAGGCPRHGPAAPAAGRPARASARSRAGQRMAGRQHQHEGVDAGWSRPAARRVERLDHHAEVDLAARARCPARPAGCGRAAPARCRAPRPRRRAMQAGIRLRRQRRAAGHAHLAAPCRWPGRARPAASGRVRRARGRAAPRATAPASVSTTSRVVRSSSFRPSCDSSSGIARLTAGWREADRVAGAAEVAPCGHGAEDTQLAQA